MEIEIIFKGKEALSTITDEEWDKYSDKVVDLTMKTFPKIEGCLVSIEESFYKHKVGKTSFRDEFIQALCDPKFLEVVRSRILPPSMTAGYIGIPPKKAISKH
jgi:hypothetical protein